MSYQGLFAVVIVMLPVLAATVDSRSVHTLLYSTTHNSAQSTLHRDMSVEHGNDVDVSHWSVKSARML